MRTSVTVIVKVKMHIFTYKVEDLKRDLEDLLKFDGLLLIHKEKMPCRFLYQARVVHIRMLIEVLLLRVILLNISVSW